MKKDSWVWAAVWGLQGEGGIQGLNGNGKNAIKNRRHRKTREKAAAIVRVSQCNRNEMGSDVVRH